MKTLFKRIILILIVGIVIVDIFSYKVMANADKTVYQLLDERFPDGNTVIDSSNMEIVKNILIQNFETKADDIAMEGIITAKISLSTSDITKYYVPLLVKYRQENGLPNLVNQMTPEQKAQYESYYSIAREIALQQANAELTNRDEFEVIAPETKNLLLRIFNLLIISNRGITINDLKSDLSKIFRGLFILQQQYGFEEDLPYTLLMQPHTIVGNERSVMSPYHRLIQYAGTRFDARLSFLSQHEAIFKANGIATQTGVESTSVLIDKLAEKKGLSTEEYYKRQTEAILGQSSFENVYLTIKNKKPSWYLPILAQGKGTYVAATSNAIIIGMLETYKDQQPAEALSKLRGENQKEPFFQEVMTGLDNYMMFLNSVKQKPVPFVTVTDTMNHKYGENGGPSWSKGEGMEAVDAVRRLLAPLKIYQPYTKGGLGYDGVSTSSDSLAAYGTRMLNKDLSGVTLFTHEMTHGNDQAAMFNGEYRVHGRRDGQGPEIFARGMFEAIDNTQNKSPYSPVFNINTALPISDTADRVQALHPLNSKEKVQKYFKNLLDLIAYLEAKEAKVALEILNETEKSIYFNKVSQVQPLKNGEIDQIREEKRSTNDRYAPFGKMGNEPLKTTNTIADLVKQDAVSAQFIPNGVAPFIHNLQTNQYDSVPLLESYYAASVAEEGKNTVGDVSFKRHAYEVLGWFGWDAFVAYVSDQHHSDIDAYTAILNGKAKDWETFKIQQYEKLEKLHPVQDIWDVEVLENNLKDAIQKDLIHIKALHERANDKFRGTDEDQKLLVNAAIEVGFRQNATNVRKVKLDILRKALSYNELMDTVLQDKKVKHNVNYEFIFEGGNRNNFNAVTLPNNIEVEKGTTVDKPQDYTKLYVSVNNDGEWKFKGWNQNSVVVNDDVTFTGTWEYRPFEEISISETRIENDNVLSGIVTIVHSGKVGKRSSFTKEVIEEMQPRVIEVGTKMNTPIIDKEIARVEIEKVYATKINEIHSNQQLTVNEKADAVASLTKIKENIMKLIADAQTQHDVDNTEIKGKSLILAFDIQPTKKHEVVTSLEKIAKEKLQLIYQSNATTIQKNELIDEVERLLRVARKMIENETLDESIITIRDNASIAIQSIQIPNIIYEEVSKNPPVVDLVVFDIKQIPNIPDKIEKNNSNFKKPVETSDNTFVFLILVVSLFIVIRKLEVKK